MEHVYIKPGTPRLNGKVERSHLTDWQEFYQLFDYKDDVDLSKKLAEWKPVITFIGLTQLMLEIHRTKC
jgi:transposase InsO family protein